MPSANIARHLSLMAQRQPDEVALKVPRGRGSAGEIDYLALTFAELESEVDAWVGRLRDAGIVAGDRVLVMVKPGLPLIAAAFALFKYGAVPVIIDPGMGPKSFLSCVRRSRPRALLGIPLARLISRIFRPSFRSVERRVAASASPVKRIASQRTSSSQAHAPVPARDCAENDLAAILFTSGSTGAPKGVCYEHGMFEAQVRLIRETYLIQPGEIDLPMLPIFALFNPALGMTTVVPEINPSRPATVDPGAIVRAILQENVTNSFGSPTLWNKIADYCIEKSITLPSMRRVLCAGAPVPLDLWEKSRRFLTRGLLHSPYGATEALPVCSVSSEEIAALHSASLDGACVGIPLSELEVRVIAPVEGVIRSIAETRRCAVNEIGEIVVHGPVVTKEYDALPEATAAAKIPAGNGSIWHRMGDTGFFDAAGRLWFTGRKVESVETANGVLYTEPIERVFRLDEAVGRCALIGLGQRPTQTPALVVQLKNPEVSDREKRSIAIRLRERARAVEQTRSITRFFFRPNFPVDVRHNAKIHRLTLARWAATQEAIEVDA